MVGSRFLQVLFWIAVALALYMAATPHPPQLPERLQDKVQHILAFTVLTGLALAAYPRVRVIWLLLALLAFGGVIEAVQAIPFLHRDSDALDWVADAAAILAVLGSAFAVRHLLLRRTQP
jgi:peptidoglycan/LPS O-acetylase OafA/YrhL